MFQPKQSMMNPPKKRKVEKACRTFKEEWMTKYFFANSKNKAVCLLCLETIAVFKDCNLKRHYTTKHNGFGQGMSEEERRKEASGLKKKLEKQQTVFKKQTTIQNSATEASFIIA